jgi:uncharacterized membrane protein
MSSEPGGSAGSEIEELRARVGRLEEAMLRRGVPSAELGFEPGARQPVAPVLPATAQSPVTAAPTAPAPGAASSAAPIPDSQRLRMPSLQAGGPGADDRSLESRIGSQWFNRVGILAVLIGMAWFLKLAIDNHWIGPLGRVLIGLLAGAGLIAWSERFRSKGYAAFSYSLKALGSGVLYLSLWASFSLFHLLPAGAAFAAMVLVTAFNGWMAWVQDAELLALYSIVGGLATPLLVATGGNHEVALFSYLLLLDITVMVLGVLRPWSRLLFMAFCGTAAIACGWWFSDYTVAERGQTGFFFACFFLIFAFAPRLARRRDEGEGAEAKAAAPGGWDSLALVLLPVLNASLGFIGLYELLDRPATQWAGPWLAVLFAAFYLVLLQLPARGRLKSSSPVLASLHLAAAVVFLTIAIPLKAEGRWLTIGWLAEGAALFWVAIRTRQQLLRGLALACLALGLGALLVENPEASLRPFVNERFGAYAVAIAVFVLVAWLAHREHASEAEGLSGAWGGIAAGAVLVMNALVLLAVSLEIDSYWHAQDRLLGLRPRLAGRGAWQVLEQHRMFAQFS